MDIITLLEKLLRESMFSWPSRTLAIGMERLPPSGPFPEVDASEISEIKITHTYLNQFPR